jgi:predicted transposase YbfD/YdcC
VRAYFFWIDDVKSVTDELRVNVRNIRRNVKYLRGIATKSLRDQVFS